MSASDRPFPLIYLARHGETAWSKSGQHTGLSDIPLTPQGEQNARLLGTRLAGLSPSKVFTSPLQRAARTCELAGFGDVATIDPDLVEWNYGRYDGKTTSEIHQSQPGWQLFRDGCPDGESVQQVSDRADGVIRRIRDINANVLLFSSGHFLRVLGARWLGLDASGGSLLFLDTASLSILGYEHTRQEPVIRLWNDFRRQGQ